MTIVSLLIQSYVAAGVDDGLFLLQHQVSRHVATPSDEWNSHGEQDFQDDVNSDELSELISKKAEDFKFKGNQSRQPVDVKYYVDGSVSADAKWKLQKYLRSFNAMNVGVQFVPGYGRGIKFYTGYGSQYGFCEAKMASREDSFDVGCIGWHNLQEEHEKILVNRELGHLVGMFNEHTRNDRDDYIAINWACVAGGKEGYYRENPKFAKAGPYDPFSVTHPHVAENNKCPRRGGQKPPIITLKNPASVNATSPVNYGSMTGEFSELDKQYLRRLYSDPVGAKDGAKEGRFTHEGCPCKKSWSYRPFGWIVNNYCKEYNGMEICFVDQSQRRRGCDSVGICA